MRKNNHSSDDSDSETETDYVRSNINPHWFSSYNNGEFGDEFPENLGEDTDNLNSAQNLQQNGQDRTHDKPHPTIKVSKRFLKEVLGKVKEKLHCQQNNEQTHVSTNATLDTSPIQAQNANQIAINTAINTVAMSQRPPCIVQPPTAEQQQFIPNNVPRPYAPMLNIPNSRAMNSYSVPFQNPAAVPFQQPPYMVQMPSNSYAQTSSYDIHAFNMPYGQVPQQQQMYPQMYSQSQSMHSNYMNHAELPSSSHSNMHHQQRPIDPRLARREPPPTQMRPQTAMQTPIPLMSIQISNPQMVLRTPNPPTGAQQNLRHHQQQQLPPCRPAGIENKRGISLDAYRRNQHRNTSASLPPQQQSQPPSQPSVVPRPQNGELAPSETNKDEIEPAFSPSADTPVSSPATPASVEVNNQRESDEDSQESAITEEVTIKTEPDILTNGDNDNESVGSGETIPFTCETFVNDRRVLMAELDEQAKMLQDNTNSAQCQVEELIVQGLENEKEHDDNEDEPQNVTVEIQSDNEQSCNEVSQSESDELLEPIKSPINKPDESSECRVDLERIDENPMFLKYFSQKKRIGKKQRRRIAKVPTSSESESEPELTRTSLQPSTSELQRLPRSPQPSTSGVEVQRLPRSPQPSTSGVQQQSRPQKLEQDEPIPPVEQPKPIDRYANLSPIILSDSTEESECEVDEEVHEISTDSEEEY
ncbi:altered inheritance of mitochondria protein 3-like isoform X2 [Contarinia nasturtii]|uniref:altered inheritance of mitochondria protein 3-like isoform X2 n=1 Tax=Contarinia nasturtii TaxID=265458 RepID=UPI0012D3EF93|nr:altered inheritance of mitochondria protein 3-like isoform X2 [Contarinia nasturtii]